MRRVQFRMPLPADVPHAVKKLVNLPAETAATLVARVGSSDGLMVHRSRLGESVLFCCVMCCEAR